MTSMPSAPASRDAHAPARTDRASDVLGATRHPLDAIFRPRGVAVVGATEREGSVGRTILWNLISSPFGGTVFPVNPTRKAILGIKASPSLSAIGEPVDLAVIVTPPPSIPALMEECAALGGDLLVMATHGRSGWQRLMQGSVAEDVVHHAHVPVLLVHQGTA